MNIILLVPTLRIGGLQSLVYTLCRGMNQIGHNVYIYNIGLSSEITHNDDKYIKIKSFERQNGCNTIKNFDTFFKLKKQVKLFKPDVIQSHTGVSDIYLSMFRSYGKYIKLRCHITPQSFYTKPLLGYIFDNFISKFRFKHHIVVNNKIKLNLLNHKYKLNQITQLQNPLPSWINTEDSNVKKYNINNINIGFIGRLSEEKGVDRLINIFSMLLPLFNNKITLTIAGKGSKDSEIRERVNDLSINTYVKQIGFINDLKKFYDKSDIVINTSRIEGVPITLLEAAAHGCLIIATRTEAAEELKVLIPNILIIDNSNDFTSKNAIDVAKWIKSKVGLRIKYININTHSKHLINPKTVANNYLNLYKSLVYND